MKQKPWIIPVLAAGVAVAATVVFARLNSRHAIELAERTALWQQEKADLEAALEAARATARPAFPTPELRPMATSPNSSRPTPAELLSRLRALQLSSGPGQSRVLRRAIHDFEELILAGPAALPVIREFLARQEDIDFAAAFPKAGLAAGIADQLIMPPSLRLGLFDVVKQIGGPEAEALFAETLGVTRRGLELAWLVRTLEEWIPNKYRETALAAARQLLARPLPTNGGPRDRADRDSLFSVLAMYGDTSYAETAQAQLVQPDGALDRSALKYLQEALGSQSVPIAVQAYQDPLILTNSAAKEPLVRLALNFVGADTQANEFYRQAINDPALTKNHRKNLIEDLNQDGFSDRKNLSAQDVSLIQNRLALIEQLAPSATDPVNIAALKEAYKDLLAMRDRAVRPPAPAP